MPAAVLMCLAQLFGDAGMLSLALAPRAAFAQAALVQGTAVLISAALDAWPRRLFMHRCSSGAAAAAAASCSSGTAGKAGKAL